MQRHEAVELLVQRRLVGVVGRGRGVVLRHDGQVVGQRRDDRQQVDELRGPFQNGTSNTRAAFDSKNPDTAIQLGAMIAGLPIALIVIGYARKASFDHVLPTLKDGQRHKVTVGLSCTGPTGRATDTERVARVTSFLPGW